MVTFGKLIKKFIIGKFTAELNLAENGKPIELTSLEILEVSCNEIFMSFDNRVSTFRLGVHFGGLRGGARIRSWHDQVDLITDDFGSFLLGVVEDVIAAPRLIGDAALSKEDVDIRVVVVRPVDLVIVEHHVADSRLRVANALVVVVSFLLSDEVPLAAVVHLDHVSQIVSKFIILELLGLSAHLETIDWVFVGTADHGGAPVSADLLECFQVLLAV